MRFRSVDTNAIVEAMRAVNRPTPATVCRAAGWAASKIGKVLATR